MNNPIRRCPFYGFNKATPPLLLDTEGNQCALASGYSPCEMEMQQMVVDWNNCPYTQQTRDCNADESF